MDRLLLNILANRDSLAILLETKSPALLAISAWPERRLLDLLDLSIRAKCVFLENTVLLDPSQLLSAQLVSSALNINLRVRSVNAGLVHYAPTLVRHCLIHHLTSVLLAITAPLVRLPPNNAP